VRVLLWAEGCCMYRPTSYRQEASDALKEKLNVYAGCLGLKGKPKLYWKRKADESREG